MNNPDLFNELYTKLLDDIDESQGFPSKRPLLAHYTSIAVLEQILLTKQIWFSNPLAMNDHEEMVFGMTTGANAFRVHKGLIKACGTPERHAIMLEAFNGAIQNFWDYQAFDTYVFSASEHDPADIDGKLSQWRGYGGNGSGAAIVFNTEKLDVSPAARFIIAPVEYRTREAREAWAVNRLDVLAKLMSERLALPDDQLVVPANAYLERIKVASIFSKHIGFSEETEWRVLYRAAHDQGGLLHDMRSHAIVRNGIEPKFKLKIAPLKDAIADDMSLEKIVDRIILGPTQASVLTRPTVQRLLLNERLGIRLYQSRTPFRAM
jgi:Protein of unknown function (DUF2971)